MKKQEIVVEGIIVPQIPSPESVNHHMVEYVAKVSKISAPKLEEVWAQVLKFHTWDLDGYVIKPACKATIKKAKQAIWLYSL